MERGTDLPCRGFHEFLAWSVRGHSGEDTQGRVIFLYIHMAWPNLTETGVIATAEQHIRT